MLGVFAYQTTTRKGKIMKYTIQILRLGLMALLLVMPVHSLLAAPPHTGIRGQAFIFYPGFAEEVAPGVWYGVGSITLPVATSFNLYSAHSDRKVGHFATDANGAFQVSLSPGKYVLVPDPLFAASFPPGSLEITVNPRHFTDVVITYSPSSFSSFPSTHRHD
jgi:hypothetical protein